MKTPKPDPAMVQASKEAYARGDYLTSKEMLIWIRTHPHQINVLQDAPDLVYTNTVGLFRLGDYK